MTATHICPPDHKHGTTMTCASSHGCRCADCKAAHREYSFFHRNMTAAGRDVFNRRVDATGTRRRIQALMCLGWSQSEIERRTGIPQERLSAHLHLPTVTKASRDRISSLFEDLCLRVPPTDTPGQRMSVNRTKALARRHRWVPPFAWDDIDTDPEPPLTGRTDAVDEVAIDLAIAGHRVRLTPPERRVCVTRLHAEYYSDGRIAQTINCSTKTVERIRRELGLPAHDQNELVTRSAA